MDEIIGIIKNRLTPTTLKVLLIAQETRVLPQRSGYPCISIEGRPSGNFRIVVSNNQLETAIFILNLQQFEDHPLKINQWR